VQRFHGRKFPSNAIVLEITALPHRRKNLCKKVAKKLGQFKKRP
jgi:hypothetical protein